jgi:uncharacterized protein (DUF1501 family)
MREFEMSDKFDAFFHQFEALRDGLDEDPSTGEILSALSVHDDDEWASSRRRFLQGALLASSLGIGGIPAGVAAALGAGSPNAAPLGANEGVLVLVHLSGGNDGFNTVVPFNDPSYRANRGSFGIGADRVLPLGGGVGLHPKLTRLKQRWDRGNVAVIQGVGYPNQPLSHFDSMVNWMRGTVGGGGPTGWVGRWLDATGGGELLRAVQIGTSVPMTMLGAQRSAVSLPPDLGNAFGLRTSEASDLRCYDTIRAFASASTGRGAVADSIARLGRDSLDLGPTLAGVVAGGPVEDDANRNFAAQMAVAGRLVNADLGVRVIGLSMGDYDTHVNQSWRHDELLDRLDLGIEALFATLDARVASRVMVLTWCEFGRRLEFNGSGTDHGTANAMFAVGPSVKGGLYGTSPNLGALDRAGNPAPTVDFRQVFSEVIGTWLGGDAPGVLGGSFASLGMLAAPGSGTVTGGASPGAARVPASGGRVAGVPGGYWTVTDDGQVTAFGDVAHAGNAPVVAPVTAIAGRPQRDGYWVTAADGSVYAFGAAEFHGGMNGVQLNAAVIAMAATPSGRGYWLLGADGGVFSFGDAEFFGSTGSIRLNRPVMGMCPTPSGRGYWFCASDGGVFAFGDATFMGSMGGERLNQPVVGMCQAPDGNGYRLVASDGGVFCYGSAGFMGSMGGTPLVRPVVSMMTSVGGGYLMVANDGGIFSFGPPAFHGSVAGIGASIVGIA